MSYAGRQYFGSCFLFTSQPLTLSLPLNRGRDRVRVWYKKTPNSKTEWRYVDYL